MTPPEPPSALARTRNHATAHESKEVNGISGVMQEDIFDDLVRRIDGFLESGEEMGQDGDVRRGTKVKVRESLGVIEKALKDFTYVSLHVLGTSQLIPCHCRLSICICLGGRMLRVVYVVILGVL
jgi:hypothetical protein